MSYVTQPIALTYGTKKEVTVSASAGTSQLLGQLTGPVQVRIVNYDTVRVAVRFGPKTATDALTLAGNPTVAPGATEVWTIVPNIDPVTDSAAVYWNIISDASPAGNKFEVTLGAGY